MNSHFLNFKFIKKGIKTLEWNYLIFLKDFNYLILLKFLFQLFLFYFYQFSFYSFFLFYNKMFYKLFFKFYNFIFFFLTKFLIIFFFQQQPDLPNFSLLFPVFPDYKIKLLLFSGVSLLLSIIFSKISEPIAENNSVTL